MKKFVAALFCLLAFGAAAQEGGGPGGQPPPRPVAPLQAQNGKLSLLYGNGLNLSGNTLVLGPPTATVLGGIYSAAAPANQFQTGNNAGVPTFRQPSFADLAGALQQGQAPSGFAYNNLAPNSVDYSKLSQAPAGTFSGNPTGTTANRQDISAAQALTLLGPCVGDTGSGGTKGLVPAPPAGALAAGLVLGAGCSWVSGGAIAATSNTQLQNISTAVFAAVQRNGFTTAGDVTPVLYQGGTSACSLNSGAGDGASQIPSADGKCWLANFPSPGPSIKQWDPLCGVYNHDCSAAIQAAMVWAGANAAQVRFPSGCYMTSKFTVPDKAGVIGDVAGLFGEPNGIPCTASNGPMGPTFLVRDQSGPFLTLSGSGNTLANFIFYYPDQVQPSASTPTTYPTTVLSKTGGFGQIDIRNLEAINAYTFLTINTGRTRVTDLLIGAYKDAIIVDGVQDFLIFDNIVEQVMWDIAANAAIPSPIDAFVLSSSTGIVLGRADDVIISNFGAFMRGTCFVLQDGNSSQNPRNSYGSATNVTCDFVAYGINATSTNSPGWLFSNIRLAGNSSGVGTAGQVGILLGNTGTALPLITTNGCTARGNWASGKTAVFGGKLNLGSYTQKTNGGTSTVSDCDPGTP